MTTYNPNRFVTGLSDISYVKQVNRVQKTRRPENVPICAKEQKPVVIKGSPVTEDRWVRDHFTPEGKPDNG